VRGKRQYFKAPLGLCIGIKKDKLVVVPATEAQKRAMELYVELAPEGELEKNELAKEILRIFLEGAKEERKEEIEQLVQRYLPPGKSRVKRIYPQS
jgi:hypothetical protein